MDYQINIVNPASGDSYTTVLDSSGNVIKTLEKGESVTVVGKTSDGKSIIEPGEKMDDQYGNGGMYGSIMSPIPVLMYDNYYGHKVISKINNGTTVMIYDERKYRTKIYGQTIHGWMSGWVDNRYLFRNVIGSDNPYEEELEDDTQNEGD